MVILRWLVSTLANCVLKMELVVKGFVAKQWGPQCWNLVFSLMFGKKGLTPRIGI